MHPDIDPEFVDAWYNKGRALTMLGKNFEAIRAFEKLLIINSHDTDAITQRDLMLEKISPPPKGQESCGTRSR
ncbi:MAG: tetratricopeptide repeat protein [Methanoregula sp.]|nr:tetratricopeptide repeat protein [Methanoregula sp.]